MSRANGRTGSPDAAWRGRDDEQRQGRPQPSPIARRILALQHGAGNAAVSRLLQRVPLPTPIPIPSPIPLSAPDATRDALAIAEAEAGAVDTADRIERAIDAMAMSANLTAKNTAELLRRRPPRLRVLPMTLRTDGDRIRRARDQAEGSVAYFFVGTRQPPLGPDATHTSPGTLEKAPGAVGTVEGDTIFIRGRHPFTDAPLDAEELMRTIIHEASHVLSDSYGELGKHLFDEYKYEFRGYFVSHEDAFEDLDELAKRIKRLIVGKSLDDRDTSYPELQEAYHSRPPTSPFRAAIDGHMRPEGFNLTNSIRLDALFTTLTRAAKDPRAVEAVTEAVGDLTPDERAEAWKTYLIRAKIERCGVAGAKRIRTALVGPGWEPTLAR